MAYGNLISLTYPSGDGRSIAVLLEKDGYAGSAYSASADMSYPAYRLEYDNAGNAEPEIASLGAKAFFITGDTSLMEILQGMRFGSERDGRLTIKSGSDVIFQGYVIPDQVFVPLNDRKAVVTIGAKDRTRSLDEAWLNAGEPYEGDITASVLIADILASTGIPFTQIRVEQTWRPGKIAFNDDPYQIKIPAKNFYEYRDDDTVLAPTKKYVLEQVLGLTLCHLVQWDGMWHICQPMARFSKDYVIWHQYDASGTYTGTNTLGGVVDLTDSSWVQNTDEGRSEPSFRSAEVIYAYGEVDNQITNGGFEVWSETSPRGPKGWTGNGIVWQAKDSIEGNYSLAIEARDVSLLSGTDASNATTFRQQDIDINQTTSAYELILFHGFQVFERLGSSYRVYKDGWAPPSSIKTYYSISLSNGLDTYRLKADGTWTLAGAAEVKIEAANTEAAVGGIAVFSKDTIEIADFPDIGTMTVKLYQAVHNGFEPLTAGPYPYPIIAGTLWDGIRLAVKEEADQGTANKSYGIFDSSKVEGKQYKKTFVIGEGPFQSSPGAIKYSDGTFIDPNHAWRPLANAPNKYTSAELHAREFLRQRRNSQATITFTLSDPNLNVTPVKAIDFDGKRFWPLRMSIEQPSGRATVYAREIRDDGVAGLSKDVREDARVQVSRSDGAAVYSDLNPRIQNAFTLLAVATTNAVIKAGLRTTIPIEPVDSIFPADTKITLVDSRTGNSFDLTVSRNYGRFEPQLRIEPFTFDQPIDTGSYIIISQAQALHRIAITENAYNRSMRAGRICALDGAVAGTVTSLTVTPTRRDIAKGEVLEIVEGLTASTSDTDEEQTVQTSAFVAAGSLAIPIVSARVDAPDGAHIMEDALQLQSFMLQNPDKILLGIERQREGEGFTKLSAALSSGTTYNASTNPIPVSAIPKAASDGDKFVIIDKRTGHPLEITLSGDHAASATSLNVVNVTPSRDYASGSKVRLTDETTRGLITVNSDNINLRVEKNDVINQINISTEGILISGSKLTIDSTTTFASSYDPSDGRVVIRYAGAPGSTGAPTARPSGDAFVAGDQWRDTSDGNALYSYTGAAWEADYTQIDGGNVKVSSQITVGTGDNVGVLSGSDATYRIWAGNAVAGSAPFRVTQAGVATMTSAVVTGEINATSGSISGNLTVSGKLNAGGMEFGADINGTLNEGIALDANNYWYDTGAFRIGHATSANYVRWDGTTLTVRGALEAADINASSLSVITTDTGSLSVTGSLELTAAGVIDLGSGNLVAGNYLTLSSNTINVGSLGTLTCDGNINFASLPTADPGVVGRLWRDGAIVKVSI